MSNNFVMRRRGSNDPWSQQIPSDGSTLSGSTVFEVKPTAVNESSYDLTGRLEVNLVGASKRLVCNLRQKADRRENEDPGKQYHFYFRGKAANTQSIFIGIESDGRLLADINATNQDISDYQIIDPNTGKIARNSTFYVDVFCYYIQGVKDNSGQYIFINDASHRVQSEPTISNIPEWLHIDRRAEVTGISDGGVPNCTCWRYTFSCEPLTNYNTDGDPQSIPSADWNIRFPLDTPDGNYRGIPRTGTARIQPEFGNQKEIEFKEYGGYRNNFIFGKQLELNSYEMIQASFGRYELVADNTGSMYQYNKSTLQHLPKLDLGDSSWPSLIPTIDFVFKLGTSPTNTSFDQGPFKAYEYIGYPWVISGLRIINTVDYGDDSYDTLWISDFHDLVNGGSLGPNQDIQVWAYLQSNSLKSKLAIKGNPTVYFHIDVISLNDIHTKGYIEVPSKISGDSYTLSSPRGSGGDLPYIHIPNIVNGKRSLTSAEADAYFQWINNFINSTNALWKSKLHPSASDVLLQDVLLGDSASTYLLVPRINISAQGNDEDGIGSNGTPRLNEWLTVEDAITSSETNASPAINSLRWGPNFNVDPSNVFDFTYDENLQFRFKLIE